MKIDIEQLVIQKPWVSIRTIFQRTVFAGECQAKIQHGPGHQSSTHCQVKGAHIVHRVGDIFWTGDSICSGYFDEAPDGIEICDNEDGKLPNRKRGKQ
jgi:hypothetical protein